MEDVQKTVNMYVNDAIRNRMAPEQVLYYSANAFGTTDAIGFKNRKLDVWDLKTGRTHASFDQLLRYVCFFLLEYNMGKLDGVDEIELRIYQGNGIKIHTPDRTEILPLLDKIVYFDQLVTQWRMEALS